VVYAFIFFGESGGLSAARAAAAPDVDPLEAELAEAEARRCLLEREVQELSESP
jgi:hypothetical protein